MRFWLNRAILMGCEVEGAGVEPAPCTPHPVDVKHFLCNHLRRVMSGR